MIKQITISVLIMVNAFVGGIIYSNKYLMSPIVPTVAPEILGADKNENCFDYFEDSNGNGYRVEIELTEFKIRDPEGIIKPERGSDKWVQSKCDTSYPAIITPPIVPEI